VIDVETTMTVKAEWISSLEEEYRLWQDLLSGFSEEQLAARRLPASLSIKDVVAHLWAWQQFSIARLEAALHGREPHYAGWPEGFQPDAEDALEDINARIHAANRDRSWQDVYRDWHAGFQRFIDLAQAVPEDDLTAEGKYPWIRGLPLYLVLEGSYRHHLEEHRQPLQEWLAQAGNSG
jgi:hypothetical protein